MFDGIGEPRAPEDSAQRIETQFAPELIERPDIAQCEGGFEADLWRRGVVNRSALGAQQTAEQGIDLATGLVDAT